MPISFDARMLAFSILWLAGRKHGPTRYARALRFARKCADRSVRKGMGRGLWDQVITLLSEG